MAQKPLNELSVDELLELAKEAKGEGNASVFNQLAAMARQKDMAEQRAAADAAREPAMTPTQAIADVAKAVPAGAIKGAAESAGMLSRFGRFLSEEAPFMLPRFLQEQGVQLPSALSGDFSADLTPARTAANVPTIPQMASQATGGLSEYDPRTRVGKVVGKAAEFAGGAAVMPMGPMRAALFPAAVSGAGSEIAGQVAQEVAPQYEGAARLAGALGLPIAAETLVKPMVGRALRGPEALVAREGSERMKSIQALQEADVPMTAGLASGSQRMRALEDTFTTPLETKEGLSAAVMRMMGSDAKLATRSALSEVKGRLGQVFDTAESMIDDIVPQSIAKSADDLVQEYKGIASSSTVPQYIDDIANKLMDSATGGQPLTGKTVADMRQKLRSAMEGAQTNLDFNTAMKMNNVVDEFLVQSIGAKNPDFLPVLMDARDKYRTFVTTKKVLNRAGAEARGGLISPEALSAATRAREGDSFILGQGTPLADLAFAAEEIVRSAPTTTAGGKRILQGMGSGVGALGAGGLAAVSGVDPVVSAMLGGAAASIPAMTTRAALSGPFQRAAMPTQDLLRQRLAAGMAPATAGILGQYMGR